MNKIQTKYYLYDNFWGGPLSKCSFICTCTKYTVLNYLLDTLQFQTPNATRTILAKETRKKTSFICIIDHSLTSISSINVYKLKITKLASLCCIALPNRLFQLIWGRKGRREEGRGLVTLVPDGSLWQWWVVTGGE